VDKLDPSWTMMMLFCCLRVEEPRLRFWRNELCVAT
jgi:hypothetical protein